jgi:hypothetical protein
MKKILGISIVGLVVSVLCMYNTVNSYSICEKIDTNEVKGGCSQFESVDQCGGGTTNCGDIECGLGDIGQRLCPLFNWNRKLEIRQKDYYYPGVKGAEIGKKNYTQIDVLCTKLEYCAATSCVLGENDNIYYCGQASIVDGQSESAYQLSGTCP